MDIETVLVALGSKERLKIVHLLTRANFCQKHFEIVLGVNQSTSSRKLKILKEANIIAYDMYFGKKRYYITEEFKLTFPPLYEYIYNLYAETNSEELPYYSCGTCDEVHNSTSYSD